MYVLQDRRISSSQWNDTRVKSYNSNYEGQTIQAETITDLVRAIIQAEFNIDAGHEFRVVERTAITPVVMYKDKVI